MADETPPSFPPAVPQTVPRTPHVAIWSLILAVLSFTCGWLFTAIPAVICGHIARAKIRKAGGALGGRGIATAGLVLGYLALVLAVMAIPLLVSMIQSERERLQRLSTERKEIASDDGKINVRVPGTWTKLPELNERASLQVGNKSKEVYLIVTTDTKTDLNDFTLEKHHDLTRDRMWQKMKNASATEPVSMTNRWSSCYARRINRDGKGYQRCFSSHHGGRRRSFSTDPRLDAQVPLAATERVATRNYPNFSRREIDMTQIGEAELNGANERIPTDRPNLSRGHRHRRNLWTATVAREACCFFQ
jgi:hypothetical protein